MWRTRYRGSPTREKEEFACINCQQPATNLYIKYSEEVTTLTDCDKCDKTVDKYIEQDVVLVVIDLMLQYVQAYRHLLLNVRIQRPERLFVIFWLSHAAEVWIREREDREEQTTMLADQEWMFYRCLLLSAVEISSFVFVILLFWRLKKDETAHTWRQMISLTMLGYYGNVAVVLSFIFRLSHRLSYQIVMQIFLLVSHIQVQRVLFPTVSDSNNIIVVLVAKTFSTITGALFTQAVNDSFM
ncbi:hypothetical protein B9Z55_004160 [Caenorhabditis nigoni]|uniref:Protein ARV n=1 Tax=Caenorhabditis nigoni TaxID=1611254 RepID=A0A2G5UVL1_9PELO|nr:hypothetical protein B9Z55_004160 [Caenorhabditis nigoni]